MVKHYPRKMEISRHFRPFEVQEKSEDSPPRVEGSRSTLKLVGIAEHQAEEVKGFQGDMVSVWILSLQSLKCPLLQVLKAVVWLTHARQWS